MSQLDDRFRMIVDFVRDHDVSDISLCGANVSARLEGRIVRLSEEGAFSRHEIEAMIRQLVTLHPQALPLVPMSSLDFSARIFGKRFRINIATARGALFASLRPLPDLPPDPLKIGLPPAIVKKVHGLNYGLILVTGPNGAGKTTTIASLVESLNQNRQAKIITIEDPIEFEFASRQAEIIQREIGTDVASYQAGLRESVRQNPDIIVIGEIRDTETALVALQAAETGHLIIGSLHASSVVETISRYLLLGPKERAEEMRYVLARTMRIIINQRLLKKRDGGRMAVREICVHAPKVEAVILKGNEQELVSHMLAGRDQGMVDFQSALRSLQGILVPEEVMQFGPF